MNIKRLPENNISNCRYLLFCRWSELTRKLEFHVEVQELNDTGEYVPVEVQPRTNVGTGGIFQLRQGIDSFRHIVTMINELILSRRFFVMII